MYEADELRDHAATLLNQLIQRTTPYRSHQDATQATLETIDAIAVYTIALHKQTYPHATKIPD